MQGYLTLGHSTGRWCIDPRKPTHEVTFRTRWGTPPGFEVPEPPWHAEGEEPDRIGEIVIW